MTDQRLKAVAGIRACAGKKMPENLYGPKRKGRIDVYKRQALADALAEDMGRIIGGIK